jgi:nitrate/nitrite-specific signal transduction histidine kinase
MPESKTRYRIVADNSQEQIELLDSHGSILYASPSHLRVLQYSSADILNKSTVRLRLRKKTGEWIDVEAILSPASGPGEAANCVLVLARDITQGKQAEQKYRGQAAVVGRILNLLAEEPDLNTSLGHVLRAITEQLGGQVSALYLCDSENDTLILNMVYKDRRILTGLEAGHYPGGSHAGPVGLQPASAKIKHEHQPFVINDLPRSHLVGNDVHKWAASSGTQAALIIPLVFADKPIGVFGMASRRKASYECDDIEFAQTLAHQVTFAIEMTRLAEQAKLTVVLQERNRIAQEIHDTLTQGFTGILVRLEGAEDALSDCSDESNSPRGQGYEEVRRRIVQARKLARDSLAESRRSVWALRPRALEQSDLARALQSMMGEVVDGTTIRSDFVMHGIPRRITPEVETDLLRIAQEALNNILKHARASRIKVDLIFCPREVRLSVQDDGHGFDLSCQTATSQGLGLAIMRERTERVCGHLSVQGRRQQGTRIEVVVPVTSAYSPK